MEGSGSASTSIDIEELLKEVPGSLQTTLREEMCIYHVPVDIRQVNKDAYTPQVICIGPIHQKNENQVIKELKRRYFKQFFNRLPVEKWKSVLEDLVKTITGCVDKIRNCYEDAAFELCKDPKGCEVKIRNCYEDAAFEPRKDPKGCEVEILDCSEDDSSKLCEDQKVVWKMILWDAVFIFELFLKNREFEEDKHNCQSKTDIENCQKKYKNDYIIAKPWLRSAVQRDLMLLENQLPFFILQVLYGIVSKYNITGYSCPPKTVCSCLPETDKTCCSCLPETGPCIAFQELACTFFEIDNKKETSKPLHFTDLVRSFFLPELDPSTTPSPPIKKLHRATRLHQAGMKFKPMQNKCLLDIRAWTAPKTQGHSIKNGESTQGHSIKNGESTEGHSIKNGESTQGHSIKKGELHVPTLEIDDHTECLFRNLMALEQCHYPYQALICEYVKFLDFLVDTKEDADLLIREKVIVNRLGESDDVAKLINKLCQGIAEVSSCYDNIATKLNDYYESPYNKSKAFLRRQYFRNVWIGTGTVVGLIVLLITLGNFVRSFF